MHGCISVSYTVSYSACMTATIKFTLQAISGWQMHGACHRQWLTAMTPVQAGPRQGRSPWRLTVCVVDWLHQRLHRLQAHESLVTGGLRRFQETDQILGHQKCFILLLAHDTHHCRPMPPDWVLKVFLGMRLLHDHARVCYMPCTVSGT